MYSLLILLSVFYNDLTIQALEDFFLQIARYITGVLIVALSGACIKLFRDVFVAKRDIAQLQEQRKSDLIEFNSIKTIATAVEKQIDLKLKDLVYEISELRHQDSKLYNQSLQTLKETLIEMNTNMNHLREDVGELKKKSKI